jgi:hypothetical protein
MRLGSEIVGMRSAATQEEYPESSFNERQQGELEGSSNQWKLIFYCQDLSPERLLGKAMQVRVVSHLSVEHDFSISNEINICKPVAIHTELYGKRLLA